MAEASVDLVGLYAAHRLGLVRLAYLLVDDLTLAEDLVQDAFLGLHRRRAALLDPVAAVAYPRYDVVTGRSGVLIGPGANGGTVGPVAVIDPSH